MIRIMCKIGLKCCCHSSYILNLPILIFFLITKILNLSHKKLRLVYLDQYSSIPKNQRLYGTMISKIYKMGEKCFGHSLFLWR